MDMFKILTMFAESCAGVDTSVLSCGDNDNGIWSILLTIFNILTVGVVTLGVVGVTIAAIKYTTARDNSANVALAKKHLASVVLGIVTWVMITLLLNLLLPGGADSLHPDTATGLVIDPGEMTMYLGDQERVHAVVQPVSANNNVTWTSANSTIVDITKDGNAKAVAIGTTTVTASIGNGITADLKITVIKQTVSTRTDTTPTDSGDGVTPIGPVYQDSTNVACASGTIDLGIDDQAYHDGVRTSARICEIPNINCVSSNSFSSNGHIVLNSRVSGAYYALGNRYMDTHNGQKLTATESYRTNERQTYFYNCYINQNCNNGNLAARPGYSNHQLGLAVDFAGISSWNDSLSQWFYDNLGDFGLVRDVSSEYWHVNPASQYR